MWSHELEPRASGVTEGTPEKEELALVKTLALVLLESCCECSEQSEPVNVSDHLNGEGVTGE